MNDTLFALLVQSALYVPAGALVVHALRVRGREARKLEAELGPPSTAREWWDRLQ